MISHGCMWMDTHAHQTSKVVFNLLFVCLKCDRRTAINTIPQVMNKGYKKIHPLISPQKKDKMADSIDTDPVNPSKESGCVNIIAKL